MKQTHTALFLSMLFVTISVIETSARQSESTKQDTVSVKKDDTSTKVNASGFQFGGYGEAIMQRMFYSDNVARYAYPQRYTGQSHGRFDLPHVVLYAGYNFGRGWKVSMEL